MSGRLGATQSLILGLVLVAAGLAGLAQVSIAEPWGERRTKTAQGATPVVLPPPKSRLKARPARQSESACGFPWTYSRGQHRCACLRDGYSLQRGNCVRDAASASCGDNERWSAKRGACVCAKGLKREGGHCISEEPVDVAVAPDAGVAAPDAGSAPAGLQDEQIRAIARVQSCLTELGYYKGPIDGKRGRETWTAYWFFKKDHGLKGQSDLLAEPVQQKVASLCKSPETTAALESAPAAEALEPAPAADQAEADATADPDALESEEIAPLDPPARLDIDCLPDDLIGLLRRAHGSGVTVSRCDAACLPAPRGLPQSQLDELQTKNGVVWCRSCLPIGGHLSLDDVRRIERAGNLELCATPPRRLARDGGGDGTPVKSYTKVRELYRALPPAEEDPAAVAVIVGNRNYAKLPTSPTSQNDAGAMYSFLTEHLGYRQDNIIDVRDAKKADLERLFGADVGLEGDLSRLVRSQPGAKVLIYFSGYGATDGEQADTYLLPVETEPYREELGGYRLSTLYANLANLNAKSVVLLLETEFGPDHNNFVLPPNLPETTNSALPEAPLPGLTVLVASDSGQRTLIDATYDIGLFTRYLIEGLAGSADLRPIGNGDGQLDSAEIYVFTAAMVQLAARKTFGLLQNPVYSSAAPSVLTSAGRAPAGPN
jgi:caspase domain-containing protein